MAKALISEGRVVQIETRAFSVHPSLVWIDAPHTVEVGDLYDGQSFTKLPPPPTEPIKTPLELAEQEFQHSKLLVALLRELAEQRGITLDQLKTAIMNRVA